MLQDHSGNIKAVYGLAEGKYLRIAGASAPCRPPGGGFSYGRPCFTGDYCILNYFSTRPQGVIYTAVVFDYLAISGDQFPVFTIQGLATVARNDSLGQLTVLRINGPASAGTDATIARISFQGRGSDAK